MAPKDQNKKYNNAKGNRTCEPVRLYVKGTVTGYKGSKVNQYPNVSLLKLDNVNSRDETRFYYGKRVAYVYKAKTVKSDSRFRVIWGVVRRAHGNSGVVQATFKRNLPAKSFGGPVRVMLYPSQI